MEAKLRILLINNLLKKIQQIFITSGGIRQKPKKSNFYFIFLPVYYWLFWKINGTFWRYFFMLFKKIVLVLSSDVSFLRYHHQLQFFKYGPKLFISFFSSSWN